VLSAGLVAEAGGARVAVCIPLRGRVDDFLVESFHKRVREATSRAVVGGRDKDKARARPADVLIFDLQTTTGALAPALGLADAIHKLHDRGLETAALVREPGSAANTLLAVACDRLFMAKRARLAPLDPAAFDPPVSSKGRKQLLEAVERYSARRPRLLPFYQALVDPALEVHAVVFENRQSQTAFYLGKDYKRLVASPPSPIIRSERVAAAGSAPKLTAADAERVGVSRGTMESAGTLAARMNIAGRDFTTLEQKGQAVAAKAAPGKARAEAKAQKRARIRPIGAGTKVVFIPLDGMVGDGMLHSVKRRVRELAELDAALVVFEIDTYGGKLSSALDIGDLIFDLPKPRTVAYVNDKAISAGALISVACDQIFMQAGSELGDCGVVTPTGEQVKSEKIDSYVRARFRKFCEGKYPGALAMAMVTQDLEVYELETHDGKTEYLTKKDYNNLSPEKLERYKNPNNPRLIVSSDELLTMTDTEAKQFGFSRASVKSREEILELCGLADREIVVLDWNWSEKLVRTLDTIGPVLLMLGILGIIIELKTPGFGVFGAVGLALLGVFFFGKYTAGLAQAWEILLFLIGVGLLAVEIFVTPGFGVLGIVGLLTMLVSLVLALQPFLVPERPWQWEMFQWNVTKLGAAMLGVFIGAILIRRHLHQAPYLGKIVLAPPPPSTTPTAVTESVSPAPTAKEEEERARELVGERGRAVTMLRPAGRAEFDGEPRDVVTEGEFIHPGEPVEICEVRGNRVVVRRVS